MSKPVLPYDRSSVTHGIVHFGVGGFHRAHQAVYIDDLLSSGKAHEWGIIGVGVLPGDVAMRDALASQDHLYTVVVKHPDGTTTPRTIGSILDFRFAPEDPQGVVELLADPQTRIVSLTVTEGGYHVHEVTGEIDTSDPALAADLKNPQNPTTVFGYITEALRLRRARGIAPFTVASCDNLPGNGEIAHRMITAFARLADPELGKWIDTESTRTQISPPNLTPQFVPLASTQPGCRHWRWDGDRCRGHSTTSGG